jgi:uncharacterized protein (DUF433 family)
MNALPNLIREMTIVETVKQDAGLYTLAQAALFARMPFNTLNYWHYGTKTRQPLRESEIQKQDGKFVTFLEFVEAVAIRSLRQERNIPLPKIREAIKEAQDKYHIKFPFAQQVHKTVVVGKDIHILLGQDATMIGLTGRDKAQKSFKPFLEPYMENMRFNAEKVACEFVTYRYGEGDKIIKMNPRIGFGEPLVGKTGYTAETLWSAAVAEASIDKACQYYEVDRESVVAACSYWEGLAIAA